MREEDPRAICLPETMVIVSSSYSLYISLSACYHVPTCYIDDETPLTPPSKEALRFLLDCVSRLSGERGVAIPESFYTELLKGLVLEGITPYARKLLELRSSGQVRKLHVPLSYASDIDGSYVFV
jgi:hypothetical protein